MEVLKETTADQDEQDNSFEDELLPDAIEVVMMPGKHPFPCFNADCGLVMPGSPPDR